MTKKYNVGDTIYVKGKVKQVDEDDEYPYSMVFNDSNYTDATDVWISDQSIVEPSKEQAQVTLPKDVADEMEEYKSIGFDDLIDYFSAFNEHADNVKNSIKYVCGNTDEINNQRISNLADAWNHGYVLAQEHLYLACIPLPFNDTDSGGNPCNCAQLCRHSEGKLDWYTAHMDHLDSSNEDYKFTQEEIKRITDGYPTIVTKQVHGND